MLVRDGLKSQKSGFVGPHLTDCLRLRDIRPVAGLTWLRPASSRPVTTADGQGEDATMPGLSGTSNLHAHIATAYCIPRLERCDVQ